MIRLFDEHDAAVLVVMMLVLCEVLPKAETVATFDKLQVFTWTAWYTAWRWDELSMVELEMKL